MLNAELAQQKTLNTVEQRRNSSPKSSLIDINNNNDNEDDDDDLNEINSNGDDTLDEFPSAVIIYYLIIYLFKSIFTDSCNAPDI